MSRCFAGDIDHISTGEFRRRNEVSWSSNIELWTKAEAQSSMRNELYEYLLGLIPSQSNGATSIGDFACGSGKFASLVGSRFKTSSVYGYDKYSHPFLDASEASPQFFRFDVEFDRFQAPFLDYQFCILAAFEFASLDNFFHCAASGLKERGKLFLVVLDSVTEYQRILLEKARNQNCRLYQMESRLVLESHFFLDKTRSNEPYFRVLYSVNDYIKGAGEADLKLGGIYQAPICKSSAHSAPEFLVLEFHK